MVTKQGSVEFLPDQWKAKAREIADAAGPQNMTADALNDFILGLIDRCVTEAVMKLLAEMDDPAAATKEALKNLRDAV